MHAFLSYTFFFSKSTFSKNSFGNTIKMSTCLDTDQDRHSARPDLGPNCLQRLSADDKRRLPNQPVMVIVRCFLLIKEDKVDQHAKCSSTPKFVALSQYDLNR